MDKREPAKLTVYLSELWAKALDRPGAAVFRTLDRGLRVSLKALDGGKRVGLYLSRDPKQKEPSLTEWETIVQYLPMGVEGGKPRRSELNGRVYHWRWMPVTNLRQRDLFDESKRPEAAEADGRQGDRPVAS